MSAVPKTIKLTLPMIFFARWTKRSVFMVSSKLTDAGETFLNDNNI